MITEVYFMSNGMVVVFDGHDQQIPELQGHYDSVRSKLFKALDEQEFRPRFWDQNTVHQIENMIVSKGNRK